MNQKINPRLKAKRDAVIEADQRIADVKRAINIEIGRIAKNPKYAPIGKERKATYEKEKAKEAKRRAELRAELREEELRVSVDAEPGGQARPLGERDKTNSHP